VTIRTFISYAREDKIFADRLYDELARQPDISPWIDTRNLLAGTNWKDEILTEIETSNFILIILSSRSISKDGFFQREMREAIERLSLIAPGHRVIIPVRVEECEPKHRELRLLNYLDLYPSWDNGIERLYEAIGVRRFTHTYRVTGESRTSMAYLTPIEEDTLLSTNKDFAYISLMTLPKVEATRIPSEALPRKGGPLDILVELWSVASFAYKQPFYRKEEWSILDQLLFSERSEEDKQKLGDIFIRQWAYAQEQKETYRLATWYALYRLIQNYKDLPYV
jgi:transposase